MECKGNIREGMQMRLLLIGSALATIGLAVSPATARDFHYSRYHYTHHHYARHHYANYHNTHYHYTEPRYKSCRCHFGYDGKSAGACVPNVTCAVEGGVCGAACPSQTNSTFRSMTNSTSVVTDEVARKCEVLTAKAYPPLVVGNPAAGSAKGTGLSERDYFAQCLANRGNVEDQPTERSPPPNSHP